MCVCVQILTGVSRLGSFGRLRALPLSQLFLLLPGGQCHMQLSLSPLTLHTEYQLMNHRLPVRVSICTSAWACCCFCKSSSILRFCNINNSKSTEDYQLTLDQSLTFSSSSFCCFSAFHFRRRCRAWIRNSRAFSSSSGFVGARS